jgi:hypothetical protein
MSWIRFEARGWRHAITVSVDGKPVKEFGGQDGFRNLELAVSDGDVEVSATFEPLEVESRRRPVESELVVMLCEGPLVEESAAVVGATGIDAGHGEVQIKLRFDDDVPRHATWGESHWADARRQQRTYLRTAEGSPFDQYFEKETMKSWAATGEPVSDETLAKGRIVDATDYKPDGSVGARVVEGQGERREFNDDGSVANETPVRDGHYHGTEKIFDTGKLAAISEYVKGERHGPIHEYYPDGKVAVRGQYEHGRKHGEWIIYNPDGSENRRVTFRRGELIQGGYDFPNWE